MRIFAKFHEKILVGEASAQLTAREVEVVRWTSEGKTSAEIAIILGLSEHTVISHITSAARKLKAVNRVHMIAIAVRKGIVH
jgi:DNA-binding CsgD family transcriptional regulator